MLDHPLIEKLHELKLYGMAKSLAEQRERDDLAELRFEARVGLMVDREAAERENRSLTRRLRQAKLRYPATIEDLDFRRHRGLDKRLVMELAGCDWVKRHKNVLITGPTGVGKSYLACALAHKACREGYRARYFAIAKLAEALETGRLDGSLPKLLRRIERADVLVIDDFGLTPMAQRTKHDLLEILEDRYERRSTIVASQFPVNRFYELIDDATVADAILDRLIHNAYRLELEGESYRKIKAEQTEQEQS